MYLVVLIIISITTLIVPALVMELLAPELEISAPRQKNYRGKEVWHGLGLVWALWVLGVWVGGIAIGALIGYQPSWLLLISSSLPLILGSCLFGLFDDWIGAPDKQKGFSGHLHAFAQGRMTTGFLKLLGIGLLAVFTAASLTDPLIPTLGCISLVLLKAAVIALSANLINLLDLRPARALKSYSFGIFLLCCFLFIVWVLGRIPGSHFFLILCSIAPVISIWRFDAHERGILGDAGANAMGAYLGFLFVAYLPWPLLFLVFIVLAGLNLLSERYSFTELIESNRVLKNIDDLGRLK